MKFQSDIFPICCGYLVLLFSEMLFLHMNDKDVIGVFTAARDRPEPERPNTASQVRISLHMDWD